MKRLWLTLLVSTLACNLPDVAAGTLTPLPPTTPQRLTVEAPTESPGETPVPTITEEPGNPLPALIESVSAERLMAHIEALAMIESRHVNAPGIEEAADTIYRHFEIAGGDIAVRYESFPLDFNGVTTTQHNVIAVLPGTDQEAPMIVVGAHYDSRTVDYRDPSRAPGADDNASGVAALLELARVLADVPLRQTVVLVAFSAEEIDRSGSIAYVQGALARGESIEAMLSLDMIGSSASAENGEGMDSLRVFSAGPNDSASREVARFAAMQGEAAFPGFDLAVQDAEDRPDRWSDHFSFFEAGIPAIRFIAEKEDLTRQHSAADTADRVSAEYVRRATQIALVTVLALADGPPVPQTPTLDGDRLTWPEVAGAAGYVVALRAAEGLEYGALIEVAGTTTLRSEELVSGAYDRVSVAARDSRGLVGVFSEEVAVGD